MDEKTLKKKLYNKMYYEKNKLKCLQNAKKNYEKNRSKRIDQMKTYNDNRKNYTDEQINDFNKKKEIDNQIKILSKNITLTFE